MQSLDERRGVLVGSPQGRIPATRQRMLPRACVAWAWLIDPLARLLEVLKLENGRWTILATHVGGAVVRAEPFEAIELELAALWGDVGDYVPSSP